LRLRVTGVVQGVGFRPFVHRLAVRHALAGWVRNEAGEVRIHLEGHLSGLQSFVVALPREAPVLARIDSVEVAPAAAEGATGFEVRSSGAIDPSRVQPVPADVATCDACLAELRDPANRRYRYPFITCTDCGPRYTVIEAVPYERARTSMRAFPMCPACQREFAEPGDRRFHSETNSCGECGPSLWFEQGGEAEGRRGEAAAGRAPFDAAISAAAALLAGGGILALRGIGGFHLAVDATSDGAVSRLRERKHREAKPLAVMVGTLAAARELAECTDAEAAILAAPDRPIVLLRARPGVVSPAVHPGLDRIGVMLAYSPIHHLLLAAVGRPLVMTSGNLSDEPIAASLAEGRARLGSIADGFLMHDREIVARADDSVVRVAAAGPVLLRRARGHAPLPLALPVPSPRHLLAVGPHLKNTATLARDGLAFVTPHVGDLETLESLDHFHHLVAASRRLFHVTPEVAVRDLHPGYLSTRVANESGLPVLAVQHHHAHIAAVLAEHGRTDHVIGLAFDGTGYGEDGAVWGAEVLAADLQSYARLGQLRYAPLPGGDLAARRPWRVALGYLSQDPGAAGAFRLAFEGVEAQELAVARRQVARGLNAPLASSMGRLFDAAAAVLGVRQACHYEGQAAMELEALAARRPGALLPFPISDGAVGSWIMEPIPLLAALGERRQRGDDLAGLAASFHSSVAAAAVRIAALAAAAEGVRTVALGGGVFQNARLLDTITSGLQAQGLEVLLPQRLSPNDGAISYGQAAIGAARLAADAGSIRGAG
jgi:hydrogenase maturation protein HypF